MSKRPSRKRAKIGGNDSGRGGKKKPRVNPRPQRLPAAAVNRDTATGQLQRELKGHSHCVFSVAFSPNGERVASGGHDSTIRIWDAATGQLQRELEGHSQGVASVAFSPNGARVASGSSDNTVRFWDAATGQLQRELKGHSRPVTSVFLPPNGVTSVAFSLNGERVVSGSLDNTIWIWDAATGQLQRELKGHSSYVTSVAFSPSGMRVASGSGDYTVRIWDAHSRFHPTARDASGQLYDLQDRATFAIARDIVDTDMLPAGPVSIIKEFAIGQ